MEADPRTLALPRTAVTALGLNFPTCRMGSSPALWAGGGSLSSAGTRGPEPGRARDK